MTTEPRKAGSDMTASTSNATPAKRPRRARVALLAVLLLLIGVGLLWYSVASWQRQPVNVSTGPSPTTALSPLAQTQTIAATPSPGGTLAPPSVIVFTTYVAVPTYVNVPASAAEGSGLLALITTASGLLASLAGIVSAVVSMRGSRPR